MSLLAELQYEMCSTSVWMSPCVCLRPCSTAVLCCAPGRALGGCAHSCVLHGKAGGAEGHLCQEGVTRYGWIWCAIRSVPLRQRRDAAGTSGAQRSAEHAARCRGGRGQPPCDHLLQPSTPSRTEHCEGLSQVGVKLTSTQRMLSKFSHW